MVCLSCGIVLPLPEDIPLLLAGMQVGAGRLDFWLTAATVLPAVLLRDGIMYGIGFTFGEVALARGPLPRLLGEDRIGRARQLVEERAGVAVLIGRFSLGFRTVVFVVAGATGVRPHQFLLWDVLGLLVAVPAWLILGWLVGEPVIEGVQWLLARRWLALGLGLAAIAAWLGWRHRRP